MLEFLVKWYMERKRDKIIFVEEIVKGKYKLNNGMYIKENTEVFKKNKLPYILGDFSLFNKHNKKIFFFDLKKAKTIVKAVKDKAGFSNQELDAYMNGGFISSLRNFMKKSLTDWILVILAFLGGMGFFSMIQGFA